MTRGPASAFRIVLCVGSTMLFGAATGFLQDLRRVALKNGESVELGTVYYIANCRSIMTAKPEIEVLEGPAEVTVTIKEGMVLPRNQNCPNKVPGGTIVATANGITESKLTKLFYRVKYKTKDGDRQTANGYYVGLFP
jgi:hypothetical protein